MTIHVSKEVEGSIKVAVQSGQFASADDMITKLVQEYSQRTQPPPAASDQPPPAAHKPIWEVADEIRKSIPAEEWAKLPPDGAAQLDHYIYGSPKRPTQ
jgi:Arc/MetJ-type ribon-helix-helix transcriptional regulator